MSRIGRREYWIESARLAAKRSTCLRLQVGAVLIDGGRIVVSGYNGVPQGFPHCTPADCGPDHPCTKTVHAEANCIAFAARNGIMTAGTFLITTDSPCPTCARLIINAGITLVLYEREYRDTAGIELLQRAHIDVQRYASQS